MTDSDAEIRINKTKTVGEDQAFPGSHPCQGLTKREYFAAAALQGFITSQGHKGRKDILVSEACYCADMLIWELNK